MEVVIINISIHSEKAAVKEFLEELMEILNAADFCIDRTLTDLEYDSDDVVSRLKELTLQEYSETLIDKDFDKPPLLFVFGKDINKRLVYIKLKNQR